MPDNSGLITIAKQIARLYGLDGALVCAVIEQESNWNQWATRYEPAFEEKYITKLGLTPTEAKVRSISWGLMQVMGQVAVEEGLKSPVASLCDIQIGLRTGCSVLAKKIRAAQELSKGLLAWNGGNNPNYPNEVLSRVPKYQ